MSHNYGPNVVPHNSHNFINTNVIGTYNLIEISREYIQKNDCKNFHFVHISTDEVFGDLPETGYFNEDTPYDPSSPYSASKASSDHLVSAWMRTYNFPATLPSLKYCTQIIFAAWYTSPVVFLALIFLKLLI